MNHLELTRRLYGRQPEMETLKKAFMDVCQGQQVTVFVSGYAGLGKTALVYESMRFLDLQNGYFVMGKSDALGQNIPYAPLAAALSNLVKQLITESQEDLNRWKKRILRTLGRNAKVVAELVPQLKWIVGELPDVDTLPPSEAQNRFRLVLRSFIGAITGNGCPLVLFLDDLQWADPASIQLLQFLIRDADLPYLLIIGAYREVEAKDNKALMQMLESSEKKEYQERSVVLMPLGEEQTTELVAQTLCTKRQSIAPLASALHHRSGGNPFFLKQLLTAVFKEGLLYHDTHKGRWIWDQAAMQRLQPDEDVLAFLTEKLKKFTGETLELLKLAACLGNSFRLHTLTMITGQTIAQLLLILQPVIAEGLLIQNERDAAISSLRSEKPVSFSFLHDRVQQAVYVLIDEETKKEIHMTIGRQLLQHRLAGPIEDKILNVMDHFNRSLELIVDPTQKIELAAYNLMAGRKAKAAIAYNSALQYFKAGI